MSARIPVVDDEVRAAALFRLWFRRGIREGRLAIDFAPSAAEAIGRIRSGSGTSSVPVLSVSMSSITGLDPPGRVKGGLSDLPASMIAAHANGQTRKIASDAGAGGFYSEPLDFRALRAATGTWSAIHG